MNGVINQALTSKDKKRGERKPGVRGSVNEATPVTGGLSRSAVRGDGIVCKGGPISEASPDCDQAGKGFWKIIH